METGIECLGTLAGSSQLQTQQCLFLSNPGRGGSLAWPCFGLGLLWAELNHLTLICNFQQLINLGLFKCPQPALWWFGLPWWCAGVWVMRQIWEKPEASLFPMRVVLELRLFLLAQFYCLGLKPDSSVVAPGCCHPASVLVQVLWDYLFWGWGYYPAIPASSSAWVEQSLVLPNNCIFPAGELSLSFSCKPLGVAPTDFWLKNFGVWRFP